MNLFKCLLAQSLLIVLTMGAPGTAAAAETLRFSFTGKGGPGVTQVEWNPGRGAPLYDAARGYGFVGWTSAQPARVVHTTGIYRGDSGFMISGNPYRFAQAATSLRR